MFNAIFTSSTPATRPDWCDSVGSWRCSDRDALDAALATCPGVPADVYSTYETDAKSGAKRIWVGLRDNRGVKAERIGDLAQLLRGHGLSVRVVRTGESLAGLRITDRG